MKIALLGDIAMFGNFSIKNNNNLLNNLDEISRYLSQYDYVIGNLETPFTHRGIPHGAKSAYLGSDVSNISILKRLNISAVCLANNHLYDFGPEGVATTIDLLEKEGISWFGIDGKDYRIEEKGNRIVFNGFCCYSTNPLKIADSYGSKGINRLNYNELFSILQKNHNDGWLNIFSIHSGIEHVNRPSIDQVLFSRALAQKHPYIWYGHHPHVIQGIDAYNGSIIAHSLGNFSSSIFEGDKLCPVVELQEGNRIGMILELNIEANAVKDYKATLTFISDDGKINFLKNSNLVEEYSKMLEEAISDPESYDKKRQEQWSKFTIRRKEMRNPSWFIKRLRPRYFKLYYDYRSNKKKYNKNIGLHLANNKK